MPGIFQYIHMKKDQKIRYGYNVSFLNYKLEVEEICLNTPILIRHKLTFKRWIAHINLLLKGKGKPHKCHTATFEYGNRVMSFST